MKNKLSYLVPVLAAFAFSFSSFTAKPACAAGNSAQVLGFVNNCSTPSPYEVVTATCGTETLSGQTGSTGGDLGKYSLTFHNASCKRGSTVSVTSNGITNTGTIGSYFWFTTIASVDLQIGTNCPVESVPEFGAITGLVTLLSSGGAFYLLKKRA